jgi:hypothetical protein
VLTADIAFPYQNTTVTRTMKRGIPQAAPQVTENMEIYGNENAGEDN